MKRPDMIIPLLATAIFLFLFGSCSAPRETDSENPERPNIILFVTDDQSRDDAGCYGNPVIQTPALDQLASEGTRFSHAFCSTTSCSASRSTILSGLHNHATGQYGHEHDWFHFRSFDTLRTLPVVLTEAGYRTMHVGKFHVAPKEVYRFEESMGLKEYFHDARPGSFSEIPPKEWADQLEDFIGKKSERPFFLYFCTFDPHSPYRREGSKEISPEEVIIPSHLSDIPGTREQIAKYYMSVERADKGLARLMEILKETGQWENTVVMFTSDNGRPFHGAKMNMWDPGINLPFVVYDPFAGKRNITSDAMISFTDIMPTILDYAEVEFTDYPLHGRSFRSQVEVENSTGYDTVYCSHTFHDIAMYYPMRVVRTRQYKLIWNIEFEKNYRLGWGSGMFADRMEELSLDTIGKRSLKDFMYRPEYELYDLNRDPDEIRNLAYDPAYREVFEGLKQKIWDFQLETRDGWVVAQHYHRVRALVDR